MTKAIVNKYLQGESEVILFRLQKTYVKFGDFQQALYEAVDDTNRSIENQ